MTAANTAKLSEGAQLYKGYTQIPIVREAEGTSFLTISFSNGFDPDNFFSLDVPKFKYILSGPRVYYGG